jgi:hypothetical protein
MVQHESVQDGEVGCGQSRDSWGVPGYIQGGDKKFAHRVKLISR